MRLRHATAALLAWVATIGATVPVTTVSDPWVLPVAARGTTRAFLVLGSSTDATLVGARSALAEVSLMQGKRSVDEIAVRAGEPVAMSANGIHLRLRGVTRTLALGERVPLSIVLRDATGRVQEVPVSAEVRRRSAIEDEKRAHGAPSPPHAHGAGAPAHAH